MKNINNITPVSRKKYVKPKIDYSIITIENTICNSSQLHINPTIHVEWQESPTDSRDLEWYEDNVGF